MGKYKKKKEILIKCFRRLLDRRDRVNLGLFCVICFAVGNM